MDNSSNKNSNKNNMNSKNMHADLRTRSFSISKRVSTRSLFTRAVKSISNLARSKSSSSAPINLVFVSHSEQAKRQIIHCVLDEVASRTPRGIDTDADADSENRADADCRSSPDNNDLQFPIELRYERGSNIRILNSVDAAAAAAGAGAEKEKEKEKIKDLLVVFIVDLRMGSQEEEEEAARLFKKTKRSDFPGTEIFLLFLEGDGDDDDNSSNNNNNTAGDDDTKIHHAKIDRTTTFTTATTATMHQSQTASDSGSGTKSRKSEFMKRCGASKNQCNSVSLPTRDSLIIETNVLDKIRGFYLTKNMEILGIA